MKRIEKIAKELNSIRESKGDTIYMESLTELVSELNLDGLKVEKSAVKMLLSKLNGVLYNLQKK